MPTFLVEIFVAGDLADARRICREHCMAVGLCVTIEPIEFIYTGGAETGVKVALTNYPRFPATEDQLWNRGISLAVILRAGLSQWSVLVRSPSKTMWLTTRPGEPEK